MNANNNLQNTAYWIIIILGVGLLLHLGSSILLPLIFGTLLAIFLYPIDKRILKVVKFKGLSITLSFLTIILPITLVSALFSFQLMKIMSSLPSIEKNIGLGIEKVLQKIGSIIPSFDFTKEELIEETMNSDLEGPATFITDGLMNTTSMIFSLALTFIYTFFILYYRKSFRNFIIYQFEKSFRPDISQTLSRIKETVQSYIGGLGLVIIILSVVNSIGLLIIGVEYAIFWGALAGLLAVIPYVGTLIGGLLPALYSFSTSDNPYEPIIILIFYGVVQQIEGNLITPKIIGSKVDINPLFAIIAVIFLGTFWGIGGIVLALPIFSIVRIILDQFEETKPIAVLMSANITNKAGQFKKLADD